MIQFMMIISTFGRCQPPTVQFRVTVRVSYQNTMFDNVITSMVHEPEVFGLECANKSDVITQSPAPFSVQTNIHANLFSIASFCFIQSVGAVVSACSA